MALFLFWRGEVTSRHPGRVSRDVSAGIPGRLAYVLLTISNMQRLIYVHVGVMNFKMWESVWEGGRLLELEEKQCPSTLVDVEIPPLALECTSAAFPIAPLLWEEVCGRCSG